MIEFDLSGDILTAIESFCRALGYELREIVGKHHSMFVEAAYTSCTAKKIATRATARFFSMTH